MKGLHDATEAKFTIIEGSVFDLPKSDFDIAIALNIFHHFLKKKDTFIALEGFLERLTCRMMILETHSPDEAQMAKAYKNMQPQEFANFIAERLRLKTVREIGTEKKRSLFKLSN